MTQLTASADRPIDNSTFDVSGMLTGTSSNRTSTGFQVDVGLGYTEIYTGAGLTYDSSGKLTGGTLTGLQETYTGTPDFTMSGFSIDAVTFARWEHDGDSPSAIEGLFGGDDTLLGSQFNDVLSGFGGNNVLMGGDGGDKLTGGPGNDHLYGQSPNGGADGADSMNGGDGMDYLQGNAGNDTIDAGNGPDRVNGGANDDLIKAGAGNDYANGNKGNDTIDAGTGDDTVRGGQDQDSISGGGGNDSVSGDLGDDTLIGGTGADTLTGGGGGDRFQFGSGDASFGSETGSQTDVISDYTDGSDKIALGFSVTSILTGADQSSASGAATYAQQLLDNHAGNNEVAAIHVGSDTYLFYSGSGGATVDSAIRIAGVAPGVFDPTDFV